LPLTGYEGSWDAIASAIGTQLLPRLEMLGADLFPVILPLAQRKLFPSPLSTIPPAKTTSPNWFFVLAGQAQMLVNSRWLSLPKGYGAFLPEGTSCIPYVGIGERPTLCDWLWFQVHPFGVVTFRAQLTLTAHHQSPSYIVADQRLSDLFNAWRQEQLNPNPHKVASKGLLCAFFALLMRSVPLLANEASLPPCAYLPNPLKDALRFLHCCYDKPLCLRELAKACGVTPAYLCRLFRRYLGTTPWQYLGQLRLRFAEQLLRETTLSVAAIATLVGFHDLRHFQRLFRRTYGIPPSQIRTPCRSKFTALHENH
jgi:AraC-like DNA-binding protein